MDSFGVKPYNTQPILAVEPFIVFRCLVRLLPRHTGAQSVRPSAATLGQLTRALDATTYQLDGRIDDHRQLASRCSSSEATESRFGIGG